MSGCWQRGELTLWCFHFVERGVKVRKDALDLNLIWELIEALKTCWIGLLNSNKSFAEPAAELGKRAVRSPHTHTFCFISM